MRTLITGGNGFIGRRVVQQAADTPGEWHAAGLRGPRQTMPAGVSWHEADMLDAGAAERLIDQIRPDRLMHLAWVPSAGSYRDSLDNFRWVAASLNLIRAFRERGGTRVVCAGSCAEYDWSHPLLSEDTTPLVPTTPYGRCKNALRTLVEDYARLSGLSLAWARVFFVFGADEGENRLVGSVLRAITSGRPAECGSAARVRDYLHVDDVAAAFLAILSSPHQGPINIGSGQSSTIGEIVGKLASCLGRPSLVRFGCKPTPAGEPERLVADVTRLHRVWTPRATVEERIEAVVLEFERLLQK